MKFALAQFTQDEIESFWPGIETMLDAVPHTWRQWTKEWIRCAVEDGLIKVWGIGPPPNAVLIFFTQILTYPNGKILLVPWGAGSFDVEMSDLVYTTLFQYAKMNNCTSIEVRGRPGWEPFFRPFGFKREYVTWARPVPDMRMN